MFSAAGQTTQKPSPFASFATSSATPTAKPNPFAPSSGTSNVFGASSWSGSSLNSGKDATASQAPVNPFASPAAASSHHASTQPTSLTGQKSVAVNPFASASTNPTPFTQQGSKPASAFGGGGFGAATARHPTPTQPGSPDLNAHQPRRSNDPHAKKVYQQLRKDNINPPSWPSQPGNPSNKAEMAKFREKYEAYRSKVRASLTKAGLIDDPDQRKNLSDAIDFKGICEDMCPQYEQITRITEIDVHQPEKDPATSFPVTSRMVKKLARSAAGQEAPLPMDVRSISALRRTFDYLMDDLLQNDDNLPGLHGFLWDRTRAIRRDFTFFSSLNPEELKTQVYVLENTARFHVTALHLLSQEGKAPEDFVEQQELEQLGKALLSLRDVYDDCNDQGIVCENEPEFRAYYLVFHGRVPDIIETLQRQWRPSLWRDSDSVRTAVSLVEAMQNTQDFHGPLKDGPSLVAASSFLAYFRIVENPSVSYTMACFAECHFPHIRRSILSAVNRGLARPKDATRDVTAAVLNRFLRFDTVQGAIDFAELHGLSWEADPDHPHDISRQYLILNSRQALSHPRLSHHFSQSLVEKKRGASSLPDIIHRSIFEDPNAAKDSVQPAVQEGSLFVQDKPTKTSQPSPFSAAQASPFSNQPSGATGSDMFGPSKASPFTTNLSAPSPEIKPSISSAPTATPAANPFASFTKPEPAAAPASSTTSKTPAPSILQSKADDNDSSAKQNSNFFAAAPGSGSSGGQTTSEPAKSAADALIPAHAAKPNLSSPFSFPKTASPQLSLPGSSDTKSNGLSGITDAGPPKFVFSSSPASGSSKPESVDQQTASNQTLDQKPDLFTGKDTKAPLAPAAPSLSSGFPASSAPAISQAANNKQSSPFDSGSKDASSSGLLPAQIVKPTAAQPPRDLMGDFSQWFLLGDQGLLDEFKAYMIEDMLSSVYDKFFIEQEEKRKQEEEALLAAEADAFRAYNLSLRYFYRWKEAARQKRLRTVRRQARDQARKFYEQQREAERQARKRAADRASKTQAQTAELNRPEELMHMLSTKKASRRKAEEALLASGVLAGFPNERDAVADIVRREVSPSVDGSVASRQSMRSRSGSGAAPAARGGSKTRALREELLGGSPASFRRSLPPMSASARSSMEPDSSHRKSRVSERWRLKAMGITQMPDGTAMPDSLANEVLYGGKQYRELGSSGLGASRNSSRRASIGDSGLADSFAMPPPRSTPAPRATNDAGSPTKRKRAEDDEEAERRRSGVEQARANSHKRIMSGAEQVISELRALRMEMEDGSAWLREQSERLQSEAAQSRGTTPWDGSIQ